MQSFCNWIEHANRVFRNPFILWYELLQRLDYSPPNIYSKIVLNFFRASLQVHLFKVDRKTRMQRARHAERTDDALHAIVNILRCIDDKAIN